MSCQVQAASDLLSVNVKLKPLSHSRGELIKRSCLLLSGGEGYRAADVQCASIPGWAKAIRVASGAGVAWGQPQRLKAISWRQHYCELIPFRCLLLSVYHIIWLG